MERIYKFDLFISFSTVDRDIANYIVKKIEKKGKKCFIAPRDIRSGADYASEIINGISNSCAVLLIFSRESDKSAYVLREINSAVSRNKTIIPLRVENFLPSEAMEFYLGPTHWLDAFPDILEKHLDDVINILNGLYRSAEQQPTKTKFPGLNVVDISDLLANGWDKKSITMREIELDYLCISPDKYEMNDLTEGTLESWINSVQECADASCALVKDDDIIGYCDFYPVSKKDFDLLKDGKCMITEDMIDLYSLGGEFDAYIAMIAIDPEHSSQDYYLKIFDWIFDKIQKWHMKEIYIKRIGISVYSNTLEKFIKTFGFEESATNPAKGKVYVIDIDRLKENAYYKRLINKQ